MRATNQKLMTTLNVVICVNNFDFILAFTDNVSSLCSPDALLNKAVCNAWIESFIEENSLLINSDNRKWVHDLASCLIWAFSTRAIIHLSFLSIWLWSLVPAKNAWNAVPFGWKFLCVAFTDFSLSMQRNWKPFSAIVLEFISDVSPFSGVARGVWWSMK